MLLNLNRCFSSISMLHHTNFLMLKPCLRYDVKDITQMDKEFTQFTCNTTVRFFVANLNKERDKCFK